MNVIKRLIVRSAAAVRCSALVRRIVGATLLASPFVTIAALIWYRGGIIPVIIIFGLTALIVGVIGLGVKLLWD
jgi:hypothetical protein